MIPKTEIEATELLDSIISKYGRAGYLTKALILVDWHSTSKAQYKRSAILLRRAARAMQMKS